MFVWKCIQCGVMCQESSVKSQESDTHDTTKRCTSLAGASSTFGAGGGAAAGGAMAAPAEGSSKTVAAVIELVKSICQPMMIRRTKKTQVLADASFETDHKTGKRVIVKHVYRSLIVLPKRHENVAMLELGPVERKIYTRLFRASRRKLDVLLNMQSSGGKGSYFTSILAILLKLRMCLGHCTLALKGDDLWLRRVLEASGKARINHGSVVERMLQYDVGEKYAEVVEAVGDDAAFDHQDGGAEKTCLRCGELPEDALFTKCGHGPICKECANLARDDHQDVLGSGSLPPCPQCGQANALDPTTVGGQATTVRWGGAAASSSAAAAPSKVRLSSAAAAPSATNDHAWPRQYPSAKMRALVQALQQDVAAGRKVLVFSQWTCFLRLLTNFLLGSGVLKQGQVRTLDGSMSMSQRQTVVDWLNDEEKSKSTRTVGGGVGAATATAAAPSGAPRAKARAKAQKQTTKQPSIFDMLKKSAAPAAAAAPQAVSSHDMRIPPPNIATRTPVIVDPFAAQHAGTFSSSAQRAASTSAHLANAMKLSANPKILLISLKAGGVGLNLVAASKVYMMDLWWNPAVEEQAFLCGFRK